MSFEIILKAVQFNILDLTKFFFKDSINFFFQHTHTNKIHNVTISQSSKKLFKKI